ncbi:MAG: NYN domain-containing protein [Chloroflexi bacterium]|nr:NYN domain-containing protein [Chloroflexota bacterium]
MPGSRAPSSRPRPSTPAGPPPGTAASSDPLAGIERVFIDGSNLLYALARGSGTRRQGGVPRGPEGGPGGGPGGLARAGAVAPAGAVIGRLRAAFPPSVLVDLVFDGPAAGGIKGRLATGLRVSYSGRATADSVIFEGVAAQLAADGPAGTWGILVVTDDRGLRDVVAAKGARTAGTAWLAGRIGRIGEEPSGGGPGGNRGSTGSTGARRGTPLPPRPRAGTTIGHRRPLLSPDAADRD